MPPCNYIDFVVVTISGSGGDQVAGENYTLTCQVTGGVATASSHRWLKNGSLLNDTSATLSFSPLRETDPGVYTCEGTRNSITRTSTNFTIVFAGELLGEPNMQAQLVSYLNNTQ